MLTHEVEKCPKGQSGFTLIELLIVIAIIAILAAIAIPMFMKYKQGAYLDSVRSDVKNTVTAIESYQATNGVPFPASAEISYGPGPGGYAFGTNSPTTTGADINLSSGNTINITASTCTGGYIIYGMNKNISSGSIGSTLTGTDAVSYNSCTGAYTGF